MKDENHHESVDGTLPKFEPLMPGADIPPSELPEQYESHQNIEEFFAKARLEKETSNFRNSISEWKTLVLLIVFLGLFFLIMELDFLPNGLVIPVMLLPTVVGIFVRVFVYGFSLREAVADCKVHIALSVCFLMIGIMCLF